MTSEKDDMEASVGLQVVDITPGAANQVWIFDTTDRRTENWRSHSDEV
jgi:hypothetical protein